ncbi:hypothetical protein IWQ62_005258 [Dispira parvispora]|uniref:Uncharacterized protein n=1 Tax=Dispira parvispora TaxID=1520584 RepID=A0A9W8DZU3_9FUNG|nr:hypothetical protein IWQ62_005258 [Dispira parvispora]
MASKDYSIITSRPKPLSSDELEAILETVTSMLPMPLEDEEDQEACYIELPRPVVCMAYCQNPKDVAQAMTDNVSVIHIPHQCQPLQRQVKEINKRLHTASGTTCASLGKAALFSAAVWQRELLCDVGHWITDQAPVLRDIANKQLIGNYRTRDIAVGLLVLSIFSGAVFATSLQLKEGADGWSHLVNYDLIPLKEGNKEDLYLVHREHKKRTQARADSPKALLCNNPLTWYCRKFQGTNIPAFVYTGIVTGLLVNGVSRLYR